MIPSFVRSVRVRGWAAGGFAALALAVGVGPAVAQDAAATGPVPRLVVVEDFTRFT